MAEKRHLQHVRSCVVENGTPKVPASSALTYGEIAINYAQGNETLFIKNNEDEVVSLKFNQEFEPIEYLQTTGDSTVSAMSQSAVTSEIEGIKEEIISNEFVVSQTLNDLMDSIDTKSDISHGHSINDIANLGTRLQQMEGNITTSTEFIDFYSGHNYVESLSGIPTTKRLVIANIGVDQNNISLDGSIGDGFEVHVIVKNTSNSYINVYLTTLSSPFVVSGGDITVEPNSYGEFNIISDGTNYYVRGI